MFFRPFIQYLGLDIGGTNCRVYGIDQWGREVVRSTLLTKDNPNQMAGVVAKELAQRDFEIRLNAVGVAVAGNVQDGILIGSGNLPGWENHHVSSIFSDALGGAPVVTVNDCFTAAFGEYSVQKKPLVFVGWGTGVGVATVTERSGWPIVRPTELGHMIIDYTGWAPCGCGGFGHLESLVGGSNLEEVFGVSVEDLTDPNWETLAGYMAKGLYNISLSELNMPIVLGGGIPFRRTDMLKLLREAIELLQGPAEMPELSLAELGEDSGLMGAIELAKMLGKNSKGVLTLINA